VIIILTCMEIVYDMVGEVSSLLKAIDAKRAIMNKGGFRTSFCPIFGRGERLFDRAPSLCIPVWIIVL